MSQPIANYTHELPKDLYIDPNALLVVLELFEGPLDLLLYLIRKQNIDILAIPIVDISNQYIAYINAMQVLNIDLAAEYLLMAAILLEIKSRLLLPKPPRLTSEEEVLDPRQELINKLLEYERIKLAARELDKLPVASRDYMWLNLLVDDSAIEYPLVRIIDLQKAYQHVLDRTLALPKEHHIKREQLSVREHMSGILRLLTQVKQARFYDLFDYRLGISHVVVNFVAILELAKEGLALLVKEEDEIIVSLAIVSDDE
jgi:segregation and condensation protein A